MLTQERLKELLHYDPETGLWTRIVGVRGYRAGSQAGSISSAVGYCYIAIDGRRYLSHRLAWLYTFGQFPAREIDHINCDRADNRLYNLREATPRQNRGNIKRSSHNSSGFKGVSFNKFAKKYSASIHVDDKKVHIGYFDNPETAHSAYMSKALEIFGDFARAQ